MPPPLAAAPRQVPHSIALDASDTVYVADRENARVQVFTAAGAHRATWPSKAGLGGGASHVWSRHVSSVAYNKQVREGVGVGVGVGLGLGLALTQP